MIVILLFIGAVLFAATMIFMQPSFKKNCWVAVGLILTLGSIGLIVLNYHNHFGTTEVKTTITYPLTSSSQHGHQLWYRQLGTKNERVYLYQTNPLVKTLKKTNPATTTVTVKQNQATNKLKITKVYRVYSSEELRILFGISGNGHQFVRQYDQFSLKPGWHVVKLN